MSIFKILIEVYEKRLIGNLKLIKLIILPIQVVYSNSRAAIINFFFFINLTCLVIKIVFIEISVIQKSFCFEKFILILFKVRNNIFQIIFILKLVKKKISQINKTFFSF